MAAGNAQGGTRGDEGWEDEEDGATIFFRLFLHGETQQGLSLYTTAQTATIENLCPKLI